MLQPFCAIQKLDVDLRIAGYNFVLSKILELVLTNFENNLINQKKQMSNKYFHGFLCSQSLFQ
jgi:hypothetical protein